MLSNVMPCHLTWLRRKSRRTWPPVYVDAVQPMPVIALVCLDRVGDDPAMAPAVVEV
jgi:hypothetical protein